MGQIVAGDSRKDEDYMAFSVIHNNLVYVQANDQRKNYLHVYDNDFYYRFQIMDGLDYIVYNVVFHNVI